MFRETVKETFRRKEQVQRESSRGAFLCKSQKGFQSFSGKIQLWRVPLWICGGRPLLSGVFAEDDEVNPSTDWNWGKGKLWLVLRQVN
jgi:hypothetical protein